MPGEAQKVDRIMGAFAAALYRDSPAPFADEDAAYVMAFSLMMLNTDLHNPAVRTKMGVEAFVKNNKGINAGADLPRAYLEGLYAAVAAEEIKARGATRETPQLHSSSLGLTFSLTLSPHP